MIRFNMLAPCFDAMSRVHAQTRVVTFSQASIQAFILGLEWCCIVRRDLARADWHGVRNSFAISGFSGPFFGFACEMESSCGVARAPDVKP